MIKRFKDFNKVIKYFELGDFETTIEVDSPTYGKYFMTEVIKVDMISACEEKNLIEFYDLYQKIGAKLRGFSKSVTLDTKKFGNQNLHKFIIYAALKEDNQNWEDPKGFYEVGKLPIAHSKEHIFNFLMKILQPASS